MMKLKLEYFGHLMQRAASLEKTLILGKIEGKRRTQQQRMRWLHSVPDSMDMNLNKLWKMVEDRGAWSAAFHGVVKVKHDLPTDAPNKCNAPDHHETIPYLLLHGKTVFHETGPWCQKRWVPLTYWTIPKEDNPTRHPCR